VETALPCTTPCLVRKSSTDYSKFRHRAIEPMIDRYRPTERQALLHRPRQAPISAIIGSGDDAHEGAPPNGLNGLSTVGTRMCRYRI